jgi:hypothetical protein
LIYLLNLCWRSAYPEKSSGGQSRSNQVTLPDLVANSVCNLLVSKSARENSRKTPALFISRKKAAND